MRQRRHLKVSLFGRLKQILKKTDKNKIEDIEEFLIENNFGVEFTENFLDEVREK
ncbi:MAG: signal recognition particle receptor subunit alpha, partial [Caldisericaceae bacterium]|nr:signal recognition particle receptor subunit alpha [Caldisericaceae bacterium]